ncbi:MAG: SDR family oxidoreductase [Ferruginibacter sp.]
MTITIFGATGMVGMQLVKQALNNGHQVRAFGRNVFTSGFNENENLHLLQGALFDEGQVRGAVKGADAVLSALGGAIDGTDKARSLGIKNIVKQMEKAGVKRIIAVGGTGLLTDTASEEGKMLLESEDYPAEYFAVAQEHLKAYEYLQGSLLSWTMVCPPYIINEGPTGLFKTSADLPPEPDNRKINAGDLALFMLDELNKNQYLQKRVGISN